MDINQDYYSWEEQAEDLKTIADQFFGKPIRFTERAKSAFSATGVIIHDKSYSVMYPDCLLKNLLSSCPAFFRLLSEIGFRNVDGIAPDANEPGKPTLDLFRDIFCLPLSGIPNDGYSYTMYSTPGVPEEHAFFIINGKIFPVEKLFTKEAEEVFHKGVLGERQLLLSMIRASFNNFLAPNKLGYAGQAIFKGLQADKSKDQSIQILKKVEIGINRIFIEDPSYSEQQWVLYLDSNLKLRITPVSNYGIFKIEDLLTSQNIIENARTVISQPPTSLFKKYSWDMIYELESLINSSKSSEADFQKFFERNPEFITGLSYKKAHPQIIMYKDDGGYFKPDFFLEPINSGFCDILDLKKPTEILLTDRNARYIKFRENINRYISQLRAYQRYFDDRIDRKRFYEKYGLNAYHPKGIIVVGRQQSFSDDFQRKQLQDLLPIGIEIWTYDDILLKAKAYHDFV